MSNDVSKQRWGVARLIEGRWVALFLLLVLAIAVRGLTMRFIRDHLSEPAWFQSGSYAIFDRQAQDILGGKSSVFWIDDPSRTDSAVYPPGYPLWVALIYQVSGERSAATVQRVQWLLDSLSVLLIVGIAVTGYGWHVGLVAGMLAALSPLPALYGASPTADSPTSWIVLAAVWMLLLAVKRGRLTWAFTAGLMAGLSCWLRANALLLPLFWTLSVLLMFGIKRRERVLLGGAVILGAVLVVLPLLVRNKVAFGILTPTGLGVGANLWEGIGETDRAAEFGAVYGDSALVEQERAALGVPPDAPFSLYFPDGVRRDRERASKALAVISAHPLWYTGVMLRRLTGMLKYAGKPAPYLGSAGVNVTSRKCLPTGLQRGAVAMAVDLLGMVQSVSRYLLLPLVLIGTVFALKEGWQGSGPILITVIYYLAVGSVMHSEVRYGLPMQALVLVLAGLAVSAGSARFNHASSR